MSDNQITELLDLAHHAWSIAVCAMQDMPIPASWGNAVETGLRERGIDVDELPYVVSDATLGGGTCEIESMFWHDHGGDDSDTYEFVLSCGHSVEWLDEEPPNFCPDCGKAVKR